MLSFTFVYASLWRRVLAFIVDIAILTLLSGLLLQPFLDFLGLRELAVTRQHPFGVVVLRTYGVWLIVSLIVSWLYYALQESSSSQATIGKRLFGIRVFSAAEERISFARASQRFWAKLLSGLIAGAGFLMVFSNSEHRALHDLLSKTQVLQDRPERLTRSPMATGSRLTA
jgi:uncharacterized RDD family membrane protein YckC